MRERWAGQRVRRGDASVAGNAPRLAAPGSLQAPLWRSIAVFRFASLAYVVVLVLRNLRAYAHPLATLLVLLGMTGWTVATAYAYARPAWRRWPLLGADLLITVAVVLVTPWVVGRSAVIADTPTLTVAWLASPVLAWAVSGGRRRGIFAALLLGAVDLAVRENITQSSLTGGMLMLLAGVAVGHFARLAATAEERLQRAVEMEAATRERERLARGIHDSVLQVLALVRRRGVDLDGEAGELARLAGEQEEALRALIADRASAGGAGVDSTQADLCAALGRYSSPVVSIAGPATPTWLPARMVEEISAAVGAALDNVSRHAGAARAWVLVEDEETEVTVSIRDDGPGMRPGRLVEAVEQGRLGVRQSIQGRVRDLGGEVQIISAPGEGTEVELRVPRPRHWLPSRPVSGEDLGWRHE